MPVYLRVTTTIFHIFAKTVLPVSLRKRTFSRPLPQPTRHFAIGMVLCCLIERSATVRTITPHTHRRGNYFEGRQSDPPLKTRALTIFLRWSSFWEVRPFHFEVHLNEAHREMLVSISTKADADQKEPQGLG